jgi:hypothetical protein
MLINNNKQLLDIYSEYSGKATMADSSSDQQQNTKWHQIRNAGLKGSDQSFRRLVSYGLTCDDIEDADGLHELRVETVH